MANNIDGQQELMPGAQKTQQPSNLAGNTGKQDRNTGLQILSDTLINGPYITLAVFRPPQPEKLPGIIHTNMAYAELLLHGRPVHGSPLLQNGHGQGTEHAAGRTGKPDFIIQIPASVCGRLMIRPGGGTAAHFPIKHRTHLDALPAPDA